MVRRHTSNPDPVAEVLAARASGADLVLKTSGTTSTALKVVRSTDSWWSSFDAYSEMSGVEAGARLWLPGPLVATMNLFAAVHAEVVGAVLEAEPARATHACLTPSLLHRRGDQLPRGTRVVVGGDALSPDQHAAAEGLDVVHYYGASELSFVACGPHAGELHAFPGAEVREVDGEIWVRSPYVARPGSGSLRTAAGWATVGDRGRLEGERIRILGRPDTVVTAGVTVLLSQVEAAIGPVTSAPYALLGVPHSSLGAVVAAVVTDRRDRERLRIRARFLAPPERPRLWRVTDELPLTAAGKVDRAALAALFGVIDDETR